MIRKFECKNCHKVFLADDQKLVICPECHSDNVEYYSVHIPYKKIIAVIAAITTIGIGIFYFLLLNNNNNNSSNNDDNDITIIKEDTLVQQSIQEAENNYTNETGLKIPPSITLYGKKILNDDDTYSFNVKIDNPPSIPYKVVLTDKITGKTIAESKDGRFVRIPPSKADGGIYIIKIVYTKNDSALCTPLTMDGFLPVQKVEDKLSIAELQRMVDSDDKSLRGNGENPYFSPDYTIFYKGLSDSDSHPSNLADVLEKLHDVGVWSNVKVESVEYDDTKHIKSITLIVTK